MRQTAPRDDAGTDSGTESGDSLASIRLRRLSPLARLVIAVSVGTTAVFTAWHLVAVFLYVSPANVLSNEYGETIRGYIYPEFEQNWKLFAPNPLQRNIAVEVRAEVRQDDGTRQTTDWIDLTAQEVERIQHSLAPSHTAQNELRRAWDFLVDSHTPEGEPVELRGELSGAYAHRIALLRLADQMNLRDVTRIQLRSVGRPLPAPEWTAEDIDTTPEFYTLNWWVVTDEDLPSGALAKDAPAQEGEQQ